MRRQFGEQALQNRFASPVSATAGLCRRLCSCGSASMRTILRSRSMPHCRNWMSNRVPTASTTSASPHRSRPSGSVTLNGSRPSSTPRPRRKASTGACSIADNAVTSSDESCAPPPQMISGRLAAPSSFAALRTASRSIRVAGRGSGACSVTGPGLPHTSMAHSSTAGPGRRLRMVRSARAVAGEACSGLRISSAWPAMRLTMPAWSRISCNWPRSRPMSALGIWPIRPSTGALVANAVSSAAPALSNPGPGTTAKACGLPVASAAPSAI